MVYVYCVAITAAFVGMVIGGFVVASMAREHERRRLIALNVYGAEPGEAILPVIEDRSLAQLGEMSTEDLKYLVTVQSEDEPVYIRTLIELLARGQRKMAKV